jgi:hypothetical protein
MLTVAVSFDAFGSPGASSVTVAVLVSVPLAVGLTTIFRHSW